jgi:DNA-binding transcriptional LysR family regulator
MDQLRSLRSFLRVVDEGSFAAAARALDLAPAVVTRQVADLEDQLGTRLLHRTTRRLTLTAVGQSYLERARQILADLDEANALAAETTGAARGSLRIAGAPPLLGRQLVPLLPLFRARHPEVDFHLLPVPMADAPQDDMDLTLIVRGQEGLVGDFVARRLARSEIVLCATPDYLSRQGRPEKPQDLERHELLVPNFAHARREWTLTRRHPDGRTEHTSGTARPGSISTASLDLLLGAACAGMGVMGTLSFLVADALRAGSLERVLPAWSVGHCDIFAAMPTRKFLPLRTRLLLDFLAEQWGGGERDPWLPTSAASEPARPA